MTRLLLIACLALTACHSVTFTRRVTPEAQPRVERWQHHVFHGLWDTSGPIDLSNVCPYGLARVETKRDVWNTVAQVSTQLVAGAALTPVAGAPTSSSIAGGIAFFELWTPSTVRVWCASAIDLDPARLAPPNVSRWLVLPPQARAGVASHVAEVFGDAFVGQLRRYRQTQVTTNADLATALSVEQQKQLLGCEESACVAELAGAIAADRIVRSSVTRLGASLVVTLTAIDTRTGLATHAFTERLRDAQDESLLDAVPALVERLVREPAADAPR